MKYDDKRVIIDLEDEIDDMKMLMMKINDDDDMKMIDSGGGTTPVTPFSVIGKKKTTEPPHGGSRRWQGTTVGCSGFTFWFGFTFGSRFSKFEFCFDSSDTRNQSGYSSWEDFVFSCVSGQTRLTRSTPESTRVNSGSTHSKWSNLVNGSQSRPVAR
ncbi:hypothetical protein HanPI659440_Chr06g0245771 [Helianthus annuus]|nr:hypothetical protein HanPI659440_Chr06g0245771 [Helianthus annuus]